METPYDMAVMAVERYDEDDMRGYGSLCADLDSALQSNSAEVSRQLERAGLSRARMARALRLERDGDANAIAEAARIRRCLIDKHGENKVQQLEQDVRRHDGVLNNGNLQLTVG